MKYLIYILIVLFILISTIQSQSNFSVEDYAQYLRENQDLTYNQLQTKFPAQNSYFKGFDQDIPEDGYLYLDSVRIKYELTNSELDLLKQNHFVVSERLSHESFGVAFHDVYAKDLPVFITSDAILHALHSSYDKILMDLEISILKPELTTLLDSLYIEFPKLISKYSDEEALQDALKDVDLYITIAKSLLAEEQLPAQHIGQDKVEQMWNAIQSETMASLPLFSERPRKLDFSQFIVRGHYTERYLQDYFKTMMWLGRMDMFLTPPPENPWEAAWSREEIRRMNIAAFLLNELVAISGGQAEIDSIDDILSFLIGESDNLTPAELATVVNNQTLDSAVQLLDDEIYDSYIHALKTSNGSGQKILSQFLLMDPFSETPGELPISFRLMGQRFIIDSYVFSNVVFDRIVYQNHKIWRPMPDPLDALFVLGNDDAVPLLKSELNTYKYASQLAGLRYLVDAYDTDFWQASLYNVWLDALRTLNPPADDQVLPIFMKTAAWRQNKINTQLSSWSQLRHDNLLYAKQSYTGGTACSYPYSFVEPNVEFFKRIADFAETAENYFSTYEPDTYAMTSIQYYFPYLKETVRKLQTIATKELNRQPLHEEEIDWLKKMLFEDGGSGAPPFSGWYSSLYYIPDDAAMSDYIIADVHTQPTDQAGNVVGRVLNVGTAQINLGIFLTEHSSSAGQPTAFVGPLMSYYEKITDNFERLTDEQWTEIFS